MTHINKNKFKDEIITTAELIISQQGYQNLSARKISSQLGCAVGSLYNSYENLNEIYLKVNQRTLVRLHQLFNQYLATSNEMLIDKFLHLSNIYMLFWKSDYHLANCLFNYSQPEKAPLPKWAQDDVDAVFKTLTSLLESSNSNLSEDPKTIVAVLWSGLHGIADLCFSKKIQIFDSQDQLDLARSFISHYLKGLLNV